MHRGVLTAIARENPITPYLVAVYTGWCGECRKATGKSTKQTAYSHRGHLKNACFPRHSNCANKRSVHNRQRSSFNHVCVLATGINSGTVGAFQGIFMALRGFSYSYGQQIIKALTNFQLPPSWKIRTCSKSAGFLTALNSNMKLLLGWLWELQPDLRET